MSENKTQADQFDTYMAARLGKPVEQVTAALDADEIIAEVRTRPMLNGEPCSEAAIDFMRNAKTRNARSQAEKDASRRAAIQRVLDSMKEDLR